MTVMAIQEHSEEEEALQLRRRENEHARGGGGICFSRLPSNSLEHFQTYCYNMFFISVRNSLHTCSYWEFIKFFFVLVNQENISQVFYSSVGDIKNIVGCFGGPFICYLCPPE